MLERVDFFIRDISAIPVADTGRIWVLCRIGYGKMVIRCLRHRRPCPRSPVQVYRLP